MSQVGLQTKKKTFCSLRLQHCFVPYSQDGITQPMIAMFSWVRLPVSNYSPSPKILAAPNRRIVTLHAMQSVLPQWFFSVDLKFLQYLA